MQKYYQSKKTLCNKRNIRILQPWRLYNCFCWDQMLLWKEMIGIRKKISPHYTLFASTTCLPFKNPNTLSQDTDWSAYLIKHDQDKWASLWDYGTYHIGDQRRLRRACASAFAVRTHEEWKQMEGLTKNQTSSPTRWLHLRIWRMSLRRTKSAIISWAGSNSVLFNVYNISVIGVFSSLCNSKTSRSKRKLPCKASLQCTLFIFPEKI